MPPWTVTADSVTFHGPARPGWSRPWKAGFQYGPTGPVRLLLPLGGPNGTGWNVLTEWDLRHRLEIGQWPQRTDPNLMATDPQWGLPPLIHREEFDQWMRRSSQGRRGRSLSLSLSQASRVRRIWSEGLPQGVSKASRIRQLGVPVSEAYKIVTGERYWWAGGGRPSWEGFSW
jgi:hypothetical protein